MEGLDKASLSQVDEKGFVPDDVRNAFFRKLRMQSGNRSCFECPNRNPTWISLTYGIYLCLECSGEHRRKGVHISFVRSVELDRFSPEQMVQMAVGGNQKALDYFKANEMGKTSSAGRAVDYNSKAAQRYKAQIETESKKVCEQYEVASKSAAKAASSADPSNEAAETEANSSTSQPKAAAAKAGYAAEPPPVAQLNRGQSAPAAAVQPKPTGPTSVVVRRIEPAAAVAPVTAAPKPSGFANPKQMAKEIDFDFDFDFLEKEASKPPPVQPKPAPSVPKAAQAEVSSRAASAPSSAPAPQKFANKKGISSEDFFGDADADTASARMDRENRYQQFANAGAISSDSYFGKEASKDDSGEDWGAVASRGKELASKGASMLSEYLAKVSQ